MKFCKNPQLIRRINHQLSPPRLRRRSWGIPGQSFVDFAGVLVWSSLDIGAANQAIRVERCRTLLKKKSAKVDAATLTNDSGPMFPIIGSAGTTLRRSQLAFWTFSAYYFVFSGFNSSNWVGGSRDKNNGFRKSLTFLLTLEIIQMKNARFLGK